ncbi:hypothetical protein [Borborobacter arsenicus]|uniref:hypothetical protein n=1 Tax=Borborobacter arsenicus TaxID=1851146 RepID=UPI001404947E|nr:hypothetical protein [Pseudaminobacter arsenicus]
MKRVKLLERLKSVQSHDLYRGRDIRSITAFMDNNSLEVHIEKFEQAIALHAGKL